MRAGFLVSLFLVLFDQGLDFLPLGTLLELMLAITSHTWKHFLAIATLSSLHPLGVGNGEYCRPVLCIIRIVCSIWGKYPVVNGTTTMLRIGCIYTWDHPDFVILLTVFLLSRLSWSASTFVERLRDF